MVDTPRAQAALIVASADNVIGAYKNQNQRDFIMSVHNIVPTIVSAAGVNQGGATVLTEQSNIVTVCAAGAGVMATSGYTKIYNRGANACLVYPIGGAQFETLGANAPISVPVGAQVEVYMTSSIQGYVG